MKQTVLFTAAAFAALSLAACQKTEAPPEAAAPDVNAEVVVPATPAAPDAAVDAAAEEAAGPIEPVTPRAAPTASAGAAAPSSTGGMTTAPNASGTETTEALVTGVTLSDMYQIEAGKIAAARGQSQAVKDFGNQMVTEHTAMNNQMKHVFAATKTPIPTQLGPRGKRMINDLTVASEADFDRLYLRQQQSAQSAELTLLSAYAQGGESSDLKSAAAKHVPRVQGHLDKVHQLQAALQ